jgi:hypothetical protein
MCTLDAGKRAKARRHQKRKISVNEPTKDTPAEKDTQSQQEMYAEQHNTPVDEECPFDPESIQQVHF